MLQVAYHYSMGLKQTEIAELYDWANVRLVNELLKEARVLGLLEKAPKFNAECCSPRERAELEHLNLADILRRALQAEAERAGVPPAQRVHTVHILSSGGSGTTAPMMLLRVAYFGASVAPGLLDRILRSRTVGVTWGFTVAAAVNALGQLDCSALRGGDRKFLALAGEPYSIEPYLASSSHIAEQLGALQNTPDGVLSLRGLPAFIPSGFDSGSDVISRFVFAHTAYGRIFGRHPDKRADAIVRTVDCVLSSVGSFEQPVSPFVEELVNKSGLPIERLAHLAHGDVGGVLIERQEVTRASAADAAEFARVARMWIGVQREDLVHVVLRARAEGLPGVLLVALGASKAGIIRAAAGAAGLASEVFMDIDCALTLAGLLYPKGLP